jgi:hypothetical protein
VTFLVGTPAHPVVFSGFYEIRGPVVLKGRVRILPGTEIYVHGADQAGDVLPPVNTNTDPTPLCIGHFQKLSYNYIYVADSAEVDLLRCSVSSYCAGMWQGFVVAPGGRLTVNQSQISDAIAGISLVGSKACFSQSPDPFLRIDDTRFSNNLLGIYANEVVFTPGQNITDSEFDTDPKRLKLPYYNEVNLDYYGLAGIWFDRCETSSPQDIHLHNNRFSSLLYGISGLTGGFSIEQNQFSECYRAAVSTANPKGEAPAGNGKPIRIRGNSIQIPDYPWMKTEPVLGYDPLGIEADHLKIHEAITYEKNPLAVHTFVFGIFSQAGLQADSMGPNNDIRGVTVLPQGIWADTGQGLRKPERTTVGIFAQITDLDSVEIRHLALDSLRFGLMGYAIGDYTRWKVDHNHFHRLDTAVAWSRIGFGSTTSVFTLLSIRQNRFDSCITGVSLDLSAEDLSINSTEFVFSCNDFSHAKSRLYDNTTCGLVLKPRFWLAGKRIGGAPSTIPVGSPNANRWPLRSLVWNADSTPTTVDGFVSILNQTPLPIEYWRYDNEFIGKDSSSNGGSVSLRALSDNTLETFYLFSSVDLCMMSSNNCGLGIDPSNLTPCIASVQSSNACPGYTLPSGINWTRTCEGSPVDFEDWPFFSRPSQPAADVTNISALEVRPDLQLGQSQPNPGKTSIQIPFYLPEEAGKTELRITEVSTGRLIEILGLTKMGVGKLELNLSGYADGIYAYKLVPQNGKASATLKFVVIR